MTRKLPKRGLPPMHPGELLREEVLPALDRPKTEIAKLLGVSRQTLYDILAGTRRDDQENPDAGSRLKARICCTSPSTDLPDRLAGQFRVQSHLQKYSCSRLTQITTISCAVSSHSRGVSRSSRTRGGMRWTRAARLTKRADADGEVVWS
jgi:hypothetical protein